METLYLWLAVASLLLIGGLLGFFLLHRRKARAPQPVPVRKSAPASNPPSSVHVPERRQAPRRWGDPIQVLILDGLVREEPVRGWVVNRSSGGLGLSAAESFLEGTILNVRIAIAPESVPWVRVIVKGCQPQSGRWFLSCQFVEIPPKEILLMFK
jgi:hypothetical protein